MDDGVLPSPPNSPSSTQTIAALALGVTGDWSQVVATWEEFRAKYGYYLRADVLADPQTFLREALGAAHGRGQLRLFLTRLTERGLTDDTIQASAEPLIGPGMQLEAYVNGAWAPQHALVAGRRLLAACDHVCRIAVNGKPSGTGVLIRPTVIATAAHVVKDLVDAQGNAKPDSLGRLEITFFDADQLLADGASPAASTVVAQLHSNWLAYRSPPAAGETAKDYAIDCLDGITAAGPWDLALVRLAEPPRAGLSGHPLHDGDPPAATFGVHVLHHPADPAGGQMPLLWSIGDVTKALGAPVLRWLHDANTDGGSSGAPCFDSDWKVVGLHQAGETTTNKKDKQNRAVPIYPWGRRVDALALAADTTPYVQEIVADGGGATPVLGRRELQERVWRAMQADAAVEDRAILIYGERRTGRTFTGSILTALATKGGGRAVTVDVLDMLEGDALEFARRLVGVAGPVLPPGEVAHTGLTSELRDLRNDIIPFLMRELERLAAGAPLWLMIDGLEAADLVSGSGASQVVDAMLSALASAPMLRLALVGWNGISSGFWQEWLPPEPTRSDIAQHLWRSLAPAGAVAPRNVLATILVLADAEYSKHPTGPGGYERAVEVTRAVTEIVRSVISVNTTTGQGAAHE